LKQSDFEEEFSGSNNYNEPREYKNFSKGEMTGRFEMGSTIVLIFEVDSKTSLNVVEGQKLRLGDLIVKQN
jgi:phosphatidylserine decarboxylase